MAEEEIPFGVRHFPAAVALFGAGGVGFVFWSRSIDEPTFVFPLGRVDEESARLYILIVGIACFAYLAMLLHIRFLRRPRVRIGDGEVTIPLGEFGSRTHTLRKGDVLAVSETTKGRWRRFRVQHEGGEVVVHSGLLPDDAAYERVCNALRGLVRGEKRAGKKKARREGDD